MSKTKSIWREIPAEDLSVDQVVEALFTDAPNPKVVVGLETRTETEPAVRKRRGAYRPDKDARPGVKRVFDDPEARAEGAPPRSPTVAKTIPSKPALTKQRRAIEARAIRGGDLPLDVMLENMRWAVVKARSLEKLMDGVESKEAMADVFRLRDVAQGAAQAAAPYVHAKLAPIVPKGETGLVVNLVIEEA